MLRRSFEVRWWARNEDQIPLELMRAQTKTKLPAGRRGKGRGGMEPACTRPSRPCPLTLAKYGEVEGQRVRVAFGLRHCSSQIGYRKIDRRCGRIGLKNGTSSPFLPSSPTVPSDWIYSLVSALWTSTKVARDRREVDALTLSVQPVEQVKSTE